MPTDPKDIQDLINQLQALAGKNLFGPIESGLRGVSEQLVKMIDSLSPKRIGDFYKSIDEGYKSIAKSMGTGTEFTNQIKVNLANAATEMSKFGLTATESYQKAAQMNTEYVSATGRGARLTQETFGKLEATSLVTGETTKKIIDGMVGAGISLQKTDETLEQGLNRAREIGASGQIASKKMLDNLSAMDKFSFQGGIEGLAKMSAQATAMNVNMEAVLAKAEQLLNPENAIETAAALQRLGVTQSELLDPMRLMNLAQNDPAELQKQMVTLSKEFVHMNEQGKIEIMPGARERMKLIGEQLGMSTAEMTKMAKASFELDDKMKSIKFPDIATDEQKQMFANLAKLGKDGTYTIDIDGQEVGLEEAMQKALTDPDYKKQLEEAGQPKTMEQIATEQLSLNRKQYAASVAIAEAVGGQLATSETTLKIQEAYLKGQETMGNTLRATIKPEGVRKGYDEFVKTGGKSILEVLGGQFEQAGKTFVEGSSSALTGALDFESGKEVFIKGISELGTEFPELATAATQVKNAFEKLGNTILTTGVGGNVTQTKDLIKSKNGLFETLPEDAIIAGTGIEKIMEFDGNKILEKTLELTKSTNEISVQRVQDLKNFNIEGQIAKIGDITKNTITDAFIKGTEDEKRNLGTEKTEIGSGTITLNFNFTSDSNSSQFADKIVDMFKNNTELQQTVTKSIAQVASGQGTYRTETFNSFGKPQGIVTSV